MVHRRTHPRSPVQSQRRASCLPFVIVAIASLAFWSWQNIETIVDWWDGERAADISGPRRAKANLVQLFSTDDYPRDAVRRNEQGTVSYRLIVNRRGNVSECQIVRSSGSRSLDDATCDILEDRARFEPARNSAGERIPDEFSGRIRWELPEN